MKIKILDAVSMGVEEHYRDGEIAEIKFSNLEDKFLDTKYPYFYSQDWEGKYFEIVEDSTMNIGDRVVFTNETFTWCGEQFTVIDVDKYVVKVLSDTDTQYCFNKHNLKLLAEDPANKQASTNTMLIDRMLTFTLNHKNLEISFEDGMITLRDWDVRLNQPMDYRCDTIEQLEELMGAWESVCKFKSKE